MIKSNRTTFIGEFFRIENKEIKRYNTTSTYTKTNVILKKIHLAKDNSFFCPYAKFQLGKSFDKLGKLLYGTKIKFNARYTEYSPDHFKLSHPTKIECAEDTQWQKAHKEIKNYNMSNTRIIKLRQKT